MSTSLAEKKILVTGGLGQVGFAIVERLKRDYPTASLHVLDLSLPKQGTMAFVEGVQYHAGSITDRTFVKGLFEEVRPVVIFHTAGLIPQIAARLGLNRKEEFMKVNLEGTRIMVDEGGKLGIVKAFVLTSSADVVKGGSWDNLKGVKEDTPIPTVFDGWYAESKVFFFLSLSQYRDLRQNPNKYQAKAETLVLAASIPEFPTTALRSHACFSPNDTNLLPLVLSTPRNIQLGLGTNLYDFTYTPNLAYAHLLAAANLLSNPSDPTKSAAGKAFFITNAEPMPFKTFMGWIWNAYEGPSKGTPRQIPVGLAKGVVWLGEKIQGKKATLTVKELGDGVSERWFDNGRAKEILGYAPETGLEEAVKIAVEGYKAKEVKKT
jgi:sterol-4alpha-carboxylate 3-dehydrogenase (decarboxylating)